MTRCELVDRLFLVKRSNWSDIDEFQIWSKYSEAPLDLHQGTPGCRGTHFGKPWSRRCILGESFIGCVPNLLQQLGLGVDHICGSKFLQPFELFTTVCPLERCVFLYDLTIIIWCRDEEKLETKIYFRNCSNLTQQQTQFTLKGYLELRFLTVFSRILSMFFINIF